MRLPDLLASRRGRLSAFFFLYFTEGLPLGFGATAIATQLRRQGVGPAEIGAFVAAFYLPWAFKWAFGPVVDVFASDRFGRRRGWILMTQVLMAGTLLATMTLKLPEQLALFSAILLIHNTFGAMQDVAIDALACNTLQENERGLATGLMFGGATVGQLVGGSGVLFLIPYIGLQAGFVFVAACLLVVTALVVLPMREPPGPPREPWGASSRLAAAGREMRRFAADSFRSFLGTRGAFAGVFFSVLPAGAMCLGLSLQSNLAVELGMDDDQVAWLAVWTGVTGALGCIAGGHWSDRFGRRRMLSIYTALMSLPVLWMAWMLLQHGWIMPVDPTAANRPAVPAVLVTALWTASIVYAAFNGLMYGAHSALCMDVTNPAVAATQFTAYMALANLAISFSASWQGVAAEAIGYPKTMAIDAVVGLVCIALIPLMARPTGSFTDALGPQRARGLATGLALMCFIWVPVRHWQDALGAAQPIVGTLFTLVFVASALFLLAAVAVLDGGTGRGLKRTCVAAAVLLLAMHARHYLDALAGGLAIEPAALKAAAEWVLLAVPILGGAVLLRMAREAWGGMQVPSRPGMAASQPA